MTDQETTTPMPQNSPTTDQEKPTTPLNSPTTSSPVTKKPRGKAKEQKEDKEEEKKDKKGEKDKEEKKTTNSKKESDLRVNKGCCFQHDLRV